MEIVDGSLKNKVTNTLASRNLFRLRRIHGTRLADGIRQTAMCSPLTYTHLFQHDTKALYPGVEKIRVKSV
jgi:hypothetical protein